MKKKRFYSEKANDYALLIEEYGMEEFCRMSMEDDPIVLELREKWQFR